MAKKLADGTDVFDRMYYYLLDWNEWNLWEFMYTTFQKRRLCDLNAEEFKILWLKATEKDTESLN